MSEIRLLVMRHDQTKAWPKAADDDSPAMPEPARYVDLAEALTTPWPTDAHTCGYSVPTLAYRLRLDALVEPELASGWPMVLLAIDVDAPGHGQKPKGDPEKAALAAQVAAWWAGEVAKLDALEAAHPGFFLYRSRSGGYRIVYRLAVPFVAHTDADREVWRVRYQRELLYLARAFGIVGDPACSDLTRLFRLPRATREGDASPLNPETRGDASDIGVWTHEPTDDELPADRAIVTELVEAHPETKWGAVARRIAPPKVRAERAKAAPKARASSTSARSSAGRAEASSGEPPTDEAGMARAKAWAAAALDGVMNDIAATPGHITGGNNAVNAGVYWLGRFVPHLLDEHEVRARALEAAHQCGVVARDGADGERKILSTIDSAMRAGKREPVWPDLGTAPAAGDAPSLVTAAEASGVMAETLRSPSRLQVLRSTPGAGKSREVRQLLVEHVARGAGAVTIVPTHALAGQMTSELGVLGVAASAPMSIARVQRLQVLGQVETPACLHAEAADLLIRSGVRVRQAMCSTCTHQEDYQGTGAECPAYAAGGAREALVVLQQPLLGPALATHAARLALGDADEGETPVVTIAVVDETLPLTTATPLVGAWAAYKKLRAGEMREDAREAIEPLLAALAVGLTVATEQERDDDVGLTVRELAALGGLTDEDVAARIVAAAAADGAALWTAGLQKDLARWAVEQAGSASIRERLERMARLTMLCEAIVDAAHHPDMPALRSDLDGSWHLITRGRWTRRVLPYVQAGGQVRFLDATAPIAALRALFGDDLEAVQLDVEDAPGLVERRHVQWQHGARRRHSITLDGVTFPDPAEVRGPLRTIAMAAAERRARSVGLLTDKPMADALRAWLGARGGDEAAPAMVPDELVAFVDGGGELLVGHYGAQRGLDLWAGCDVLATLGDPWPDLGAARAEALALGLDPDAWALDLTRAELLQAWGRARTVHRTTPVLVLHLGSLALAPTADWAPQWGGVAAETVGAHRPASVRPPSDPATWAAERAASGQSARQHADALGVSWTTYRRLAAEVASAEVSTSEPNSRGLMVGHNSVQDKNQYGGSTEPEALSLIPSYGPPETPSFQPPTPAEPDHTPLTASPRRPALAYTAPPSRPTPPTTALPVREATPLVATRPAANDQHPSADLPSTGTDDPLGTDVLL